MLHLVNGLLDLSLVDLVEGACGLVKNEHVGLLEEGTSKSDSLLLASRELSTTSTDIGIDAIRVLVDKAPGICLLKGLL